VSSPGVQPSLFYTSPAALPGATSSFRVPGPKVCQQSVMSCNRCRPNHNVCGPGSSSRLRFTYPPSCATRRIISWSLGATFGGGSRFTTTYNDCHSAGSNTASQLISGQLRPNRQRYSTRQATIRYTARHGSNRSTASNRRSSTRHPDFNTRKKTSTIQRVL
jgi:hypothetical protein